MKKILTISIVLLTGLAQFAQAQLASFNFSAATATVGGWSNVSGDPHKGVRTATTGGITISSVDTSNWVPDPSGNCAGDAVGAGGGFFSMYVQGNVWTSWCGWAYEFSHYNAAAPQLRLTGLNKDSTYIIRMTGSDSYIGGNTQYTVSGNVNYGTQAINTYYNTNLGATFFSVKPDGSGQVNVYVNSSPNGGAVISGLQVYSASTANIGAPTVSITAPATGYIAAQGTIVTIKATAAETGQTITKVEYFANSVKIGEVDTVPYTFTWINPDTGHYQITVRATDNIGTPGSASINLAVLSVNNAIATGDGISMLPNGISLGDSVTGLGPHSLHSNRYQFLNGHQYSVGGSVTDPVNKPVFRWYDNGDWSSGTTMDRSVNTVDQIGMRYNSKWGIMEIGASDRIDTATPTIAYGIWPTSGILINSDDANTIRGRLMNSVMAADLSLLDSNWRTENSYIGMEQGYFTGTTQTYLIRSFVGGWNNTMTASIDGCLMGAGASTFSKPMINNVLGGFRLTTMDTSYTSLIGGGTNQFGGLSQLVSGQNLIARTPYGAVIGSGNVDFPNLPFTGTQGTKVANLGQYPLFILGNSADNVGAFKSNAMTILYNGRTQINTAGFTSGLTQTAVTPQAALDVVSTNTGVLLPRLTNAQRGAIASADLQNGLLLYNTDSSLFQYYNGSAWNSVGSGSGTGGGRWLFSTGTGTTIYDSLDNIAIGTSNPKGYRLAVNGAAIVNSIKVKATSLWPDYVFHKGYVLPGLTEVERYILKNHHLPGITSAAEVEKNGLDLGANQAAMLKKIEELTLYTIRQDKQVSELTSQVEALKKEMEDLKALIRGR